MGMTKKHIIDEIIRTARENKGVPLGRGRFEKETGIKQSDWCGKYWARWSDAITEAGFEPNKPNSAYDENWLIGQMIQLIRDKTRFPTAAEVKMETINNKQFPHRETIRNRLGNKFEMVQKILNYCKDKPEYKDVIEMCESVHATSKRKDEDDSEETDVQFGYVYLMKSGRYYKIGRANVPEKRNYELGTKLPEEIKTLHTIKTDDASGIEAYWHKRFDEKRVRGEWFDLSAGDVKAFKRRKFM